MRLDIDFMQNIKEDKITGTYKSENFDNKTLLLVDLKGNEHPLYKDSFNKYHYGTTNKLNLLPVINNILKAGANVLRIEGRLLSDEEITLAIKTFREQKNYLNNNKYFLGSLTNIVEGEKYVIKR